VEVRSTLTARAQGKVAVVLLLAALAGGCATPAAVANDPIPFPDDLATAAADWMGGEDRLEPVDASTPIVSSDGAVKIAGLALGNKLPAQDSATPDVLVRRHYVGTLGPTNTNIWVVGYRWRAGWDCSDPARGGPGTCRGAQFIFVDDRTGQVVQNFVTAY
jgi:hypothetical protein